MKFGFGDNRKINWRFFPLFLLVLLIIGLLAIYFIFPSMFRGPASKEIPIIIDEKPDKVDDNQDRLQEDSPLIKPKLESERSTPVFNLKLRLEN